jgi:16S rRNA processing protein RimM
MINKEDCILLGKIRKTTGFSGEVIITSQHEFPEESLLPEYLNLDLHGGLVPFFIQDKEYINNKNLKVRFLDAQTLEKARKLVDCNVYIEKKQVRNDYSPSRVNSVESYRVFDKVLGEIGEVSHILQHPAQVLLCVDIDGQEVLVPFTPGIISAVDHKKKLVYVDLPEGLIELNG